MSDSHFPLDEYDQVILSEQDFIEWLTLSSSYGTNAAHLFANDISRRGRPLRFNEAAALLKAIDHLTPPLKTLPDNTLSFIVVGTMQPEEHLLADAIASGLQFNITHDVLPSTRITASIPRSMPQLFKDIDVAFSDKEQIASVGNTLHLHASTSLRNQLVEAIYLSATEEQMWHAIAILLEIPRRSSSRYAVIDIKVGNQAPALPYEVGIDLARSILKIGWLTSIQCRVILSNASASTSLAFGALSEIQDLVRCLNGEHKPPYTSIAIELVAEALSLIMPGIHSDNAKSRAYTALRNGAARAAVLQWNLPTLNRWLTHAEYPNLGDQYRLVSISSGYLQRINSPLIRTALSAANRSIDNEKLEAYSALILHNIGEFVSTGEDLVQIFSSTSSYSDHLGNTIRDACDITPQPPQLSALVRVHMMLETVIIRRQIIVIVPIRKDSTGHPITFTQITSENTFIDLSNMLYDITSGSGDISESAYLLATQIFSSNMILEISKLDQIKSDVIIYDPVMDALIVKHYQIFKISFLNNRLDEILDETVKFPGRWLTLEDIEALDNKNLGPVLQATKNAIIKALLQEAG